MDSLTLVIFGITSNLAQIKLIPALYDMAEGGILPKDISFIGSSRRPFSDNEFKQYLHDVLHTENKHHQHEIREEVFESLCKSFYFVDGHLDQKEFYQKLSTQLQSLATKGYNTDNRIYYLATYPELYKDIFQNLSSNGLDKTPNGWVRLMIEKPIGHDLNSAKELNKLLTTYFTEEQIYRLDHYLGKETIQNILTFRFGNTMFEPLMNSEHIDHIQITASEDFGIGQRGGYYDNVGALRDVGQNHQLQMLAFSTMGVPTEFRNAAITAERVRILKSLVPDPSSIVFGQYEGYRDEAKVSPDSNTDTFYALKTSISTGPMKGIPIYIRGGKKLKESVTEVCIVFKTTQNRLFQHLHLGAEPNVLIYRIQPNEGIVLKLVTKKPGHNIELDQTHMQFCYRVDPKFHTLPDPYERLLMDTIRGDQTFFNDSEEVEAQWSFIDPLIKTKTTPLIYNPGSWGPKESDELIQKDGRNWIVPSPDLCVI